MIDANALLWLLVKQKSRMGLGTTITHQELASFQPESSRLEVEQDKRTGAVSVEAKKSGGS